MAQRNPLKKTKSVMNVHSPHEKSPFRVLAVSFQFLQPCWPIFSEGERTGVRDSLSFDCTAVTRPTKLYLVYIYIYILLPRGRVKKSPLYSPYIV